MLDAFIIDEILRREKTDQENQRQPRLEIPIHERRPSDEKEKKQEDSNRGVTIIDILEYDIDISSSASLQFNNYIN